MDDMMQNHALKAKGWQWHVEHAAALIETGRITHSLSTRDNQVPDADEVPWQWVTQITPARAMSGTEDILTLSGVRFLAAHPTLPLRWEWFVCWELYQITPPELTALLQVVELMLPPVCHPALDIVIGEIHTGYAVMSRWWRERAAAMTPIESLPLTAVSDAVKQAMEATDA